MEIEKEKIDEKQKRFVDPRINEEIMNFTRLRIFLRSVTTRLIKHFKVNFKKKK